MSHDSMWATWLSMVSVVFGWKKKQLEASNMLKHDGTNIFNWYRTVAKLPLTSLKCGESRVCVGFGSVRCFYIFECAHIFFLHANDDCIFNVYRLYNIMCTLFVLQNTIIVYVVFETSPQRITFRSFIVYVFVHGKFLCALLWVVECFNVVNAAQVSNEQTLIARLTSVCSELILLLVLLFSWWYESLLGNVRQISQRDAVCVCCDKFCVFITKQIAISMKLDSIRAIISQRILRVWKPEQSESKVFSKYGIEFIEKKNQLTIYTHAIVMQWYKEYDLLVSTEPRKNAMISRRFNRC